MWPAEIVGDVTAAIERLGNRRRNSSRDTRAGSRRRVSILQLRGMPHGFELSNTTVVTWEEGLRMRYDAHKVKKRADAVSNARAYLETGDLSSETLPGGVVESARARRDEDEDEEKTTKQRAGGKAKRKRQRVSGNDGEKDASAADEIVDETGGFKFPVLARAFRREKRRRVRATAERALDGQTAAVRTHSSKFIRQRATADKASQIREHGVRVQTPPPAPTGRRRRRTGADRSV